MPFESDVSGRFSDLWKPLASFTVTERGECLNPRTS